MKARKRIRAAVLLMSVMMVFSMMPAVVQPAYAAKENGEKANLVDGDALFKAEKSAPKEIADYPDDVYGVLHQQNQFTTVLYGTYGTECPNEKCYEALELVKSGFDNSQGALYFESFTDPDNWHSRNFEFLFKLDTTRFYK